MDVKAAVAKAAEAAAAKATEADKASAGAEEAEAGEAEAKKKWQPVESSVLVHPWAIGLMLGACLLAVYYAHHELAFFFGFAFLLASWAALWGRLALKRVEYRLHLPLRGLFPGESITLSRRLHNNKLLPLVWLEVLEPCGEDACVVPGEDRLVTWGEEEKKYYLYQFSLIKWRQTLEYSDTWQAVKRGIHRAESVCLRSGDGFGLYGSAKEQLLPKGGRIAVYPALTEVAADRVLSDIWDAYSASRGYLEDDSLIKSIRDYRISDPARRINQRLLARGQGLKVNQYEIVVPEGILFILDAASFKNLSPESLEETLSVLASLFVSLSRSGIAAGLLAPASGYFSQTLVFPSAGEEELARMLTLLAAASREDSPIKRDLISPWIGLSLLGQVYYVAGRPEDITSLGVLALFPRHKAKLLLYEAGEEEAGGGVSGGMYGGGYGNGPGGYAVRSLRAIRRTA